MKNPIRLLPLFLFLLGVAPANSETATTQALVDRYEQLLLRSPQPGASFDRVVEWYTTQGGGLEALQQKWEKNAGDPGKRRAYLILQGMLAEKLRSVAKARAFYLEALADGREPAQAARLLATLETTEGNFPAAVDAYRKALASETLAPVDRMEMMRSLALLHQRAFEDDQAIAVWREAIAKFPEDSYVLEEAGEAFLSAGHYDDARQTFTRLRELSASDPFRKIAASLRLARTSELEGKAEEAVQTYDLALAETSEGSWINREVRARIEELFRRKDDLPGLLAYYEKRTAAVPQDYQSLAAQANVLDDLGRGSEAVERIRAATKLAPEKIELRLSLIRRLNALGELDAALVEAEELAKPADAPLEALITLGDLHWARFTQTNDAAARENAQAAWKRIAPDSSTDLAQISRLAEIYAAHEQSDAALAQWQRIIALSPDAVDARQKAAEIFQKRKDHPAALAVLQDLVKDDRATPENLLQLGRMLERLEFLEDSRATGAKALALFPQNYEVLSFVWRQAIEAKDTPQVEKLFLPVWQHSPNEFFSEDAVKRYVAYVQSAGLDKEKIAALVERLKTAEASQVDALVLLRLALAQQDQEVAKVALEALKKQDNPVRSVRAAAEIAQVFGTPADQIAALKAVAAADPRTAQDSLQAVARIQAGAGQVEEALATVAQLIERSPADGALYSFYADLASRAGKNDAAIARLREAVRYVENATNLRLQLADLLQSEGDTAASAIVLQDAFQKEEQEGRRMDIFRRQIELATQTNTLDDLIASLKEKQAKEQTGARYGAYLAEIYLQQNNFSAAGEELKRSLGQNPANPAAVSRLLDLADRSGDQPESLRLAARLAELQPSRENRVAYISRLFEMKDLEKGQEEFAKVRPEILKDLTGWSALLTAMRKAGLNAACDEIIQEIAAQPTSGPEQRSELANLYLAQRNYDAAEKMFWSLLESEDFAESLAAVAAQAANQVGYYGETEPFYQTMMPFSQFAAEVQNSLQQNFSTYRGRRSFGGFSGNRAGSRSTLTPAQQAEVKALYALSTLAGARQQDTPFRARLRALLNRQQVPRRIQVAILSTINDTAGIKSLVRQQAADPQSDLEVDKFFLSVQSRFFANESEDDFLKIMRERVATLDPGYAFTLLLNSTYAEFAGADLYTPGKTLDAATKTQLREKLEILLRHPGLGAQPVSRISLARFAVLAGELATGWRLLDEAETGLQEIVQKGDPRAQSISQQWLGAQTALLIQAIDQGASDAPARFEKLLAKTPDPAKGTRPPFSRGSHFGGNYPSFVYLQSQPEYLVGDAAFPTSIFQFLAQGTPAQKMSLQSWFAKNASATELNSYTLGAIYAEWSNGKKEDSIARLEAIYAQTPTPRSAAFLLELYEKSSQPDKALAVIDTAEMQDGETREIRTLRRLRLLRAAMRSDEARSLGETLASARLPAELKQIVDNELSLLGISPRKLQNPTRSRSTSSRRSPQISDQIERMAEAGKVDEAERMAVSILQKNLPAGDNQTEINLRSQMVRSLRNMKRIGNLETALQERITKDPRDLDALIRLAEVNADSERPAAIDRFVQALIDHPENTTGVGYALAMLGRSSNFQYKAAEVMCALLRSGPDHFFANGLQLQELRNLSGFGTNSAVLLATTIDSLSPENYEKLFLPSRISRQMEEAQLLSELAESAVVFNQTTLAISLLQKASARENPNFDQMPVRMRLAELQLGQGQKSEAAETLQQLISSEQTNLGLYVGGVTNVRMLIQNLLANRLNNNGAEGQIRRLAELAEATGTLDLLLNALDEKSVKITGPSPSVFLRTLLGRPEIIQEWRSLLKSEATPSEYFNLGMFSVAVKLLSAQPDADSLIPAFLRRMPEPQGGVGRSDSALGSLAETLPWLVKYKADAAVGKYLDRLLVTALNDPTSGQNLLYSQPYLAALEALLENGFPGQARQLFDRTAAIRSAGQSGNQAQFSRIDARLAAAEGDSRRLQFLCAALPVAADRLQIRWKMGFKVEPETNDSSAATADWESGTLSVPSKSLPATLEIFAGSNAATLQKIQEIARPETSGGIEVKVAPDFSPVGLLQARWRRPDGSSAAGPLTAYAMGENLIQRNGAPDGKNAAQNGAFHLGVAGPLGEKSAVAYESTSSRQEASLPLIQVPVDPSQHIYVLSGWLKTDSALRVKWRQKDGRLNEGNISSSRSMTGQWYPSYSIFGGDSSDSRTVSIDRNAVEMQISLRLRASTNYNSSYMIQGAWDGLQLVLLKEKLPSADASQLISNAKTAAGKMEHAQACDLFLAAFQIDCAAVAEQGTSFAEPFLKANRLAELFQLLANPALYLPDPTRNQNVAVRNENLLTWLADQAASAVAPPAARSWVDLVQEAPISERLRFDLEAIVLQRQYVTDSTQIQAEPLLSLLGFSPSGIDRGRLRQLWNIQSSGQPSLRILLEIADVLKLSAPMRDRLKTSVVPADLLAAQQMLSAWLTVQEDPIKALALWKQSVAQRQIQTSATFSEEADRDFLIRLTRTELNPKDLHSAVKFWLGSRSEEQQQRTLADFLYSAATSDTPKREEYAALWVDAELLALKTPNYNPGARALELARRLLAAQDGKRLDELTASSKKNRALKNAVWQRDFERLKDGATERGIYENSWPVAWCDPGSGAQKVTVRWQWNPKNIAAKEGKYDTAISLATSFILPEIPRQQAIEIFFGEMPGELKSIGRVEGKPATGSLEVDLPTKSGFLRVESILGDQRIKGPLVPVLSGRKIFPAEGETLQSRLGTGISPGLLTSSGLAPDGSPAIRIGSPAAGENLTFDGSPSPMQPDKFYVSRAWLRRTGDGSAAMSTIFKGKNKAGEDSTLSMILSARQEATDQWILYSRAIPSFFQHTFWIAHERVESMKPYLGEIEPGTEVAGWEIFEIDDWKYGRWIGDLAQLREKAGKTPSAEMVNQALALAAIEPLTSLDYHSDWLVPVMANLGRSEELLPLFAQAFAAEPNPLFPLPKLVRIFGGLLALIDHPSTPPAVRTKAIALGRSVSARAEIGPWLGLSARYLADARQNGNIAEAQKIVCAELAEKFSDPEKNPEVLSTAAAWRDYSDGRCVSQLLQVAANLDDGTSPESATIFSMWITAVMNHPDITQDSAHRAFLLLALEACRSNVEIPVDWKEKITTGFALTEEIANPNRYMFWPSVLGDLLSTRKCPPEVLLHLRQLGFERMKKANLQESEVANELTRSAWFLIETALAQKDKELAQTTTSQLIAALKKRETSLPPETLRLAAKILDQLAGAELKDSHETLLAQVRKDVVNSPEFTDLYHKHLAPE